MDDEFKVGDYVGYACLTLSEGTYRCPVLRVHKVLGRDRFTMLWPNGLETRVIDGRSTYNSDSNWVKVTGRSLTDLGNRKCSCFACSGGLISLALVAE